MSWGDRREARLDGSERGATRPKERAARVGADDRILECERAGTSMLFGNLGAPANARPEVPEVPSSESSNHLRGTLKIESGQSPVRLVWASPARGGQPPRENYRRE